MKKLLIIFISLLMLNACGANIWNGSDLEKWVHKEAIKSGCDPNSIVLDEWYTGVMGKNIWYGHCNHSESGKPMKIEVGVDKVWTPSKP